MRSQLATWALLLVFVLHCAVTGHAVLRLLRAPVDEVAAAANRYTMCFFAITVGLAVDLSALMVLGLAGRLDGPGVAASALVLVGVSIVILLRLPALLPAARWTWRDGAILALLFGVACMAALHAPGLWDDTMYHLPLARSWLQHRRIAFDPFLRFPLFPHDGGLLIALGLMLGGEVGAQAFATIPLVVMALGLLGASEWLTGSIVLGTVAILAMFALGPVQETLGYAYVDDGLGLFCWGAALALATWAETPRGKRAGSWLILAGMLAGAAAGTKYFGAVFCVILGAYLLVVCRDWKAALVQGGAMVAVGIWWYLRSFLISGDPIHPAGGNVFGHYLWNAADLLEQKREQASIGVPPRSLDVVAALTAAGAGLFVPALGSVLLRRLSAGLRVLRFVFFLYLAFWFFVTQVPRYLAPIYAVGALLAAYVPYRVVSLTPALRVLEGRRRLAAWASTLVIATGFGWLAWDQARKARASLPRWQSTLEHRAGYRLLSTANDLIPRYGDRLVQVGFENGIYFFRGTVIGDWFGPGRYRQILDCDGPACRIGDPARAIAMMEHFGARMLALSTARFSGFDERAYARYFDTVLVDRDGVLLTIRPEPAPRR